MTEEMIKHYLEHHCESHPKESMSYKPHLLLLGSYPDWVSGTYWIPLLAHYPQPLSITLCVDGCHEEHYTDDYCEDYHPINCEEYQRRLPDFVRKHKKYRSYATCNDYACDRVYDRYEAYKKTLSLQLETENEHSWQIEKKFSETITLNVIQAAHDSLIFEEILPFFDIIVSPYQHDQRFSSSVHTLGITRIYNKLNKGLNLAPFLENSSFEECQNIHHARSYSLFRNTDLYALVCHILADREKNHLIAHKQLGDGMTIQDYMMVNQHKFTSTQSTRNAKPSLKIGLLGYHNHGKTTLAAALACFIGEKSALVTVSAEALKKEDKSECHNFTNRVVQIPFEMPTLAGFFMDCPGHSTLSNFTEKSISSFDCFLLVVSVTEGIFEHTREHLSLAKQLKRPLLAVFLNKVDSSTDSELITLATQEIRDVLSECGYASDETPVFYGSATKSLRGDPGELGTGALEEIVKLIAGMNHASGEEKLRLPV